MTSRETPGTRAANEARLVALTRSRTDRMHASLDGLSVGDALGQRFFLRPPVDVQRIAERAIPEGPWAYTDDTEMALAVVDELRVRGTIERFSLADRFAARYRDDPLRGYGAGAHRLLQSLHEGARWPDAARALFSGEGSFGNGGAMRVAPLGAYFADAPVDVIVREARASAEVTHAHPEGQAGAVCVALAAAWAARAAEGAIDRAGGMLAFVYEHAPPGATRDGVGTAMALAPGCSARHAASVLGNGSEVSAMDTVPFALFCAARWLDDYEACIWHTLEGLGDRDTTCAIAGGVVALCAPVPPAWLAAREPLRFA